MSVCNSAFIDCVNDDPQLTVLSVNNNSIFKKLPSFRRPRRLSCGKTAPIPDSSLRDEEKASSKKFQQLSSLTYSLKLKDLQQNNTIGRPTEVALLKFVGRV